jgi:hypothetical protein
MFIETMRAVARAFAWVVALFLWLWLVSVLAQSCIRQDVRIEIKGKEAMPRAADTLIHKENNILKIAD